MSAQRKMNLLVTGGNRGLGLAFLKRVATLRPETRVFFTVRTAENGEQTLENLQQTFLHQKISDRFSFMLLDTADAKSIADLVEEIKGRNIFFDAVLLNAGINIPTKILGQEVLDKTMQTNYIGPALLAEWLLEERLIRERLVLVAGWVGSLKLIRDPGIRALFSEIKEFDQLKALCDRYMEEAFEADKGKLWPMNFYGMSKLFVKLWAKVASRQSAWSPVQFYSCCPGWCKTDMTAGTAAPRTAEQGAQTHYNVMFNEFPADKNGEYFQVDNWKDIKE